jgi:DUF1680 family protein
MLSFTLVLSMAAASRAFAPTLAADPLPMSDVTLTGQWAAQTMRNQEVCARLFAAWSRGLALLELKQIADLTCSCRGPVRQTLLSLNMTRWLCHFTTTANLTQCRAAATLWHTYTKQPGKNNFTHELGFLAAGDDVKPPAVASFDACESFCAGSTPCIGFTFQAASAAPSSKIKCYWKSALHFTPQTKGANCITNGSTDPSSPICEPLPGEMGLGGYYGHYQGHWLSATSFLINATGNATVRARASAAIDALGGVMDAWRSKYGEAEDGYLFPYSPIVWDKLLAGMGAGPYYSVPFYTLHKLMAGLLDQHIFAGSAPALALVIRMAGWVHRRVEATIAAGGEELWQRVLLTEWGGMNDVLLELFRHTANPTHLATARRFNGYVFTARLAAGEDDLSELPFPHANFHLPEIVGNARAYELTGNTTDLAIVHTFFDALTANHSYCTGGSNSGECWQEPRDLAAFLSTQTEESCTQYNVLKIARHLFRWHAEARFADFYERAILNGIVGNQKRGERGDDALSSSSCGTPSDCSSGGVSLATSYIYMLPLGGAVTKAWGKSDYGFPCCWGTLSESFAKLQDSVFFASPDGGTFFVNLFVSARAKWAAHPAGVTVEQLAHFPSDPKQTSTLTVHVAAATTATFVLKVRVPGWLSQPGAVAVNGQAVRPLPAPGSYLSLDRAWGDGDTVDVAFPMALWTAPLNDKHPEQNATVAFMYGPLVLAGVGVASDIFVPAGKGAMAPDSFIARNSSSSIEFEARSASGQRMRLIPLRDVTDEQYVVYFFTAGTKPPQRKLGYCPHSTGHAHGEGEEESKLVAAGAPPSSAPTPIVSKGVGWAISPTGQMSPAQPWR